jgi:hypothetical protein
VHDCLPEEVSVFKHPLQVMHQGSKNR